MSAYVRVDGVRLSRVAIVEDTNARKLYDDSRPMRQTQDLADLVREIDIALAMGHRSCGVLDEIQTSGTEKMILDTQQTCHGRSVRPSGLEDELIYDAHPQDEPLSAV